MNPEKVSLTSKEINRENYVKLYDFLITLRMDDLLSDRPWSEKDGEIALKLSLNAASAMPDSIKSLLFPNGMKIVFGEKEDKVRVAEWDINDVVKRKNYLAKSAGL